MYGDGCTCTPSRECLSGPDRLDRIAVQERELQRIHGHDELVKDEQGRITLHRSIITPEWRSLVLAEPDEGRDQKYVDGMARWPGGIGEEPVFGERG